MATALKPRSKYLIVAAIDFGTTYSGYAFSFKSTEEDPTAHEQIRINTNWGANLGHLTLKTPTTVLTDKSGKFLAFGYEAEQKYQDALQEQQDDDDDDDDESDDESARPIDMLLFRNFKMMLHNKMNVKKDAKIVSVDQTIRPALGIFAHALWYLKDHLIKAISKEVATAPDADRIRWVITVPAIWSEESKQFMREAALKAGCIRNKDSDQLVIALEPEAASLCCRRINLANYSDNPELSFKKGTKYLILDCGGGTVDITTHVVEGHNTVRELSVASGGPWGGTEVDKNFMALLSEIFGSNFLNTYQKEAPAEYLSMLIAFEKVKKAVKPDGQSKLSLNILYNMKDIYERLNRGKKINKAIRKFSDQGVKFVSGSLVLDNAACMRLFDPVVNQIVDHLEPLVQKRELGGLKYLFMVGGFSECAVLQEAVRKAFGGNGLKILIPSSAQLAILKGAVLFGHQPTEISRRISRFTYGSAVSAPFIPGTHDPMYKVIDSRGVPRCEDIMHIYVAQGEEVKVGSKRKFTIKAPPSDTETTISLLRLESRPDTPVQYINVPGISTVGNVTLETPLHFWERDMEIELEFGGTEMRIEAQFKATGQKVKTEVNFLSR